MIHPFSFEEALRHRGHPIPERPDFLSARERFTLERRGMAVTYVRTPEGHEVDFLARSATGEIVLIQVSSDPADALTAERELQALEAAGRLYPKAVRRLLTLTRDAMPTDVPAGIRVQPAYEWMLEGLLPAALTPSPKPASIRHRS